MLLSEQSKNFNEDLKKLLEEDNDNDIEQCLITGESLNQEFIK